MSKSAPSKAILHYISPRAPRVAPPAYPGEFYDVLTPATLDLAERACTWRPSGDPPVIADSSPGAERFMPDKGRAPNRTSSCSDD